MFLRLAMSAVLVLTGVGISTTGADASFGAVAPGQIASLPAAETVSSAGTSTVTEDKPSVTEVGVTIPTAGSERLSVASLGAADAAPEVQATAGAVAADVPVGQGTTTTDIVVRPGTGLVGLTWAKGPSADVLNPQARARTAGVWSDWFDLQSADDGGDVGTADASSTVRDGTDAVWVGSADAVQLKVDAAPTTAAPTDLRLALVDPGELPMSAPAVAPAVAGEAALSAGSGRGVAGAVLATGELRTAAAAPAIITRAQWGADESLRSVNPGCSTPSYASTLVAAVVHHTANSNDSYSTVDGAKALLRGIQAYHVKTRGFCDIGYNFIVDKWGNIYEGRYGGVTSPVIGAHAGGFNTGTVGVSMLGDFSTETPPAAMQDAVARVIGWRLAAYGRNPSGSISYTTAGGENSRYAAGTTVQLPTVFGHRDTGVTACPGQAGYNTLGGIRARATSVAYSAPLVKALYADMLGRSVDSAGLAGWSAALSSGTSAGQLAGYIAVSEEYASAQVRRAYLDVLRREPEADGWRNWTNAVMGGLLRPEDLRGALIASQEYYLNAGGTDALYIKALYKDILRRDVQPAEAAAWASVMTTQGRGVVSFGVWKSLESCGDRVDEAYLTYLGRTTDPTGRAGWAPALQAHGEAALRTGIVNSDEYMGHALSRF